MCIKQPVCTTLYCGSNFGPNGPVSMNSLGLKQQLQIHNGLDHVEILHLHSRIHNFISHESVIDFVKMSSRYNKIDLHNNLGHGV